MARNCPCEDQCSTGSFKKGMCWSYESLMKCRNYVCRHLMDSPNHYKLVEEAKWLADTVEVVEVVETFREREAYRRGLQKRQVPL